MIIETFAMIRQQHDERLVIDASPLQIIDEASDDGVGEGNLAVVVIRVPAEVRLRRRIGSVRLIEVQEKKEWPPHLSVQPTLSGLKRLGAVSLNARDHSLAIDALATHRLDIVVEEIEPFGNARFAPQDECRHRRPRRVSVFLERLLKSGDRISEAEPDVVANAMVSGQHPGENRNMRRQREW